MRKYLFTTALVSLLAMAALAVPALATASPVLTYEGGEEVPTEAPMVASSSNLTLYNGAGTAEVFACPDNVLEGTVTANSGSEVLDEVSAASFTNSGGGLPPNGTACSWYYGDTVVVDQPSVPWCLGSTVFGTATLRSCGSGQLSVRTRIYSGNTQIVADCHYATEALSLSYSVMQPNTLTINSGQTMPKQKGSGVACPGGGAVSGSFTIASEGRELQLN